MVHYYPNVSSDHQEWIMKQPVFFSASASTNGKHINVSPKGIPSTSFSILNPNQCAYVDATGSGIETIANIYENKRCTIMFCSFGPSPRIMRLFCWGRVVEWDDPSFENWLKKMGEKSFTGMRAVIVLDVWKVQTSCGYAVPYLALKPDEEANEKLLPYLEDRQMLGHWAGQRIKKDEMNQYRANMNARSLDGLPGLRRSRRDAGEYLMFGDIRSRLTQPGIVHDFFIILVTAIAVTFWLKYVQ